MSSETLTIGDLHFFLAGDIYAMQHRGATMDNEKIATDPRTDSLLFISRRFEYSVIVTLVTAVGLVTLLALVRLFFGFYESIFINWDPKDYHAVPTLFGQIMTVLIALEFGNSILRHIKEHSTIIQAREVILIGMMAVVRKVMIIDLTTASPMLIASLGVLGLALASAYWFMRQD